MIKNVKKIALCVGAAIASCMLVASITGCGSSPTEQTAVTINGEKISEQTVTDYIQGYRKSNGLTDETDWAVFMGSNDYTPEKVRDDAISYFKEKTIISQEAAKNNVSVSDEAVDEQVNQVKEYYGYSDEKWEETLAGLGHTSATYRDYVKETLLAEALKDAVCPVGDVDEAAVLEVANKYASAIDGSQEISCIVLSANAPENEDLAAKIASGELDFDKAKSENSLSSNYDGWDALINVDPQVKAGIATLETGQVSDVIHGTTYDYIVKVNARLEVPEGGFTSKSQIPSGLYETFAASAASTAQETAFSDYIQKLIDEADIEVSPMPSGLPYDVTPIKSDSASAASPEKAESSASASSTASNASSESAASESASSASASSASAEASDASASAASAESSSASASAASANAASTENESSENAASTN